MVHFVRITLHVTNKWKKCISSNVMEIYFFAHVNPKIYVPHERRRLSGTCCVPMRWLCYLQYLLSKTMTRSICVRPGEKEKCRKAYVGSSLPWTGMETMLSTSARSPLARIQSQGFTYFKEGWECLLFSEKKKWVWYIASLVLPPQRKENTLNFPSVFFQSEGMASATGHKYSVCSQHLG